MSEFFTASQKQLQHKFNSVALANRIADATVRANISDEQASFIHARNCFYLATVDEAGFPSSSYKGGDAGFVRAINPTTLVFPNYDGNGMFLSIGNIEAQAKVGLLFIDHQTPQRIRLKGTARCIDSGPLMDSYPGANLVVELAVQYVWVNCPRYVHRMQLIEQSPYIPDAQGHAQLALWKRIDVLQDVLTPADQMAAQKSGLITIEAYESRVAQGITT